MNFGLVQTSTPGDGAFDHTPIAIPSILGSQFSIKICFIKFVDFVVSCFLGGVE